MNAALNSDISENGSSLGTNVNDGASHGRKRCSSVWTPMNIGFMVLGFVFFWPLGLFFLFWMLNGRHIADLPGAMRSAFSGWKMPGSQRTHTGHSGNSVFDEYQQTQLDRIEEIKTEVRDRNNRFAEFKKEETRTREKSEFDRFMNG